MAYRYLAVLGAAAVIAAPVAAQPDSGAIATDYEAPPTTAAPPGTPATRYCMRITLTGHVVEPVRCWTRDHWAEQGVDVDRDWPSEGVRVIDA